MPAAVRIVRLRAPERAALAHLAADADADGWRNVARLVTDLASGENRFRGRGEALYAARSGGRIVAVGGINVDPYAQDRRTGRLRRLYVLRSARRQGIGRALVAALLAHGRRSFDEIRLHTEDDAAAAFYEAIGFTPEGGAHHTHAIRFGR
jgi:GNAT superfamily N-acetyltransferase